MLPHRGQFLLGDAPGKSDMVFYPNTVSDEDTKQPGEDYKYEYSMLITGADQSGRKHVVQVTDIPLWFAVRVPKGVPYERFKEEILGFLLGAHENGWTDSVSPVNCSEEFFKSMVGGYDPKLHSWIRLNYTKLRDRKAAITLLRSVYYNVDSWGDKALVKHRKDMEVYKSGRYIDVTVDINEHDRMALPRFNSNSITVAYFNMPGGRKLLEEQFVIWKESTNKVHLAAKTAIKDWRKSEAVKVSVGGFTPNDWVCPDNPEELVKILADTERAANVTVSSLLEMVNKCKYCSCDCAEDMRIDSQNILDRAKTASSKEAARINLAKTREMFPATSEIPCCGNEFFTKVLKDEDCYWAASILNLLYRKTEITKRTSISEWYYKRVEASQKNFVPLNGRGNLDTGHDEHLHYYRVIAGDKTNGISFADPMKFLATTTMVKPDISSAVNRANKPEWDSLITSRKGRKSSKGCPGCPKCEKCVKIVNKTIKCAHCKGTPRNIPTTTLELVKQLTCKCKKIKEKRCFGCDKCQGCKRVSAISACSGCSNVRNSGCALCMGSGTVICVKYEDIVAANPPKDIIPDTIQQPLIHCFWDIETRPGKGREGCVPLPEHAEDIMFMISVVFVWVGSKDSMSKVILTTIPTCTNKKAAKTAGFISSEDVTDDQFTSVLCKSERDLIIKFGKLLERMQPDYISGFNDQQYDWPWILSRAVTHKALPEFNSCFNGKQMTTGAITYSGAHVDREELILKTQANERMAPSAVKTLCKSFSRNPENDMDKLSTSIAKKYAQVTRMKLEANAEVKGETFEGFGCIPVDVRNRMRITVVKPENTKLNWFLQNAKIASKMADMPYEDMFDIYRASDAYQKAKNLGKGDYSDESVVDAKREANYYVDKIWSGKASGARKPRKYKPRTAIRDKEEADVIRKDSRDTSMSRTEEFLRYETWRVARYCVADSWRCHALMLKYDDLMNAREVAKLTYCCMRDSYFYAGSMKVVNHVFSAMNEPHFNMICSSFSSENTVGKHKFPGAHVCEPDRGIRAPKLTIRQRMMRYKADLLPSRGKQLPGTMDDHPAVTVGGYSEGLYADCDWSETDIAILERFTLEFGYDAEAVGIARAALAGNRNTVGVKFPAPPSLDDVVLGASEPGELDIIFNPGESPDDPGTMTIVDTWVGRGKMGCPTNHNVGTKDEPEYLETPTYVIDRLTDSEIKWALKQRGLLQFLAEKLKILVTALDFKSLYPSLMMTYNLSPDRIIMKHQEWRVQEALDAGLEVHEIKFPFKGGLVQAWSVRHSGHRDHNSPKFQNGVFAHVEKILFDLRNKIKAEELKPAAKILKKLFGILQSIDKGEPHTYSDEEIEQLREDHRQAQFRWNNAYVRQNAIKLVMNTLYGVSGDKNSPFYMVAVAGGITAAGKHCIMVAKELVEKEGHTVDYGDTDSMYIDLVRKLYKRILSLYYAGLITRTECSRRLVELAINYTPQLQNRVNARLTEDNGTKIMIMAYEEVLHPVLMVLKKKYCGLQHENEFCGLSVVDYLWNSISSSAIIPGGNCFLRGLDVVRRGTNTLNAKAFYAIIMYAFSAECMLTMPEIAIRVIDRTLAMEWDIDSLKASKQYKPVSAAARADGKGNPVVLKFADLMAKRKITFQSMQRFDTVVVKRPIRYAANGSKVHTTTADYLELPEQAILRGDEIDIAHYLSGDTGVLSQISTILSPWSAHAVAPKIVPHCGRAKCILSENYGTPEHDAICAARTLPTNDETKIAVKASAKAVLAWFQSRITMQEGATVEMTAGIAGKGRKAVWSEIVNYTKDAWNYQIIKEPPAFEIFTSRAWSNNFIPALVADFAEENTDSRFKCPHKVKLPRRVIETPLRTVKLRYEIPIGYLTTQPNTIAPAGVTKKWQTGICSTWRKSLVRYQEDKAKYMSLPRIVRTAKYTFARYLDNLWLNAQNAYWTDYLRCKAEIAALAPYSDIIEDMSSVRMECSIELQRSVFANGSLTADEAHKVVTSEMIQKTIDIIYLNDEEKRDRIAAYVAAITKINYYVEYHEKRLFCIRQSAYHHSVYEAKLASGYF